MAREQRPDKEQQRRWFDLSQSCKHCEEEDWSSEFCERTLLVCSCCSFGCAHVGCEEASTGQQYAEDFVESGCDWFCSEDCETLYFALEQASGQRLPIRGEGQQYTLEIAHQCPGATKSSRSTIDHALKLFRSAFDPLIVSNGMNMLEMVCTSYESPNEGEGGRKAGHDEEDDEAEQFDFSGFRCAALRQGSTIVSVAAFRAFGTRLAEVPFVATKDGYRRSGHCKRLIGALEGLLTAHHVRYLVLPSIKALLPMWQGKFRFTPLTIEQEKALECHIVAPDFDSAVLMKKQIWPPLPPPSRSAALPSVSATSRGQRACKLQAAKKLSESALRSSRRQAQSESEESGGASDDDKDADFASDAAASCGAAGGSGSDTEEDDFQGLQEEGPDGVVGGRRTGGRPSRRGAPVERGDGGGKRRRSRVRPAAAADVPLSAVEGAAGLAVAAAAPAASAGAAQVADGAATDAGGTEMEQQMLATLASFIKGKGGQLPDGWAVKLAVRHNGGVLKTFMSPSGGKFRSMMAVARALGIMEAVPKRTLAGKPGELGPSSVPPVEQAAGQPGPSTAAAAELQQLRRDALEPLEREAKRLRTEAPHEKVKRLRAKARRHHERRFAEMVGDVLADSIRGYYNGVVRQLSEQWAAKHEPLCQENSTLKVEVSILMAEVERLRCQLASTKEQLRGERAQPVASERAAAAPKGAMQTEAAPVTEDPAAAAHMAATPRAASAAIGHGNSVSSGSKAQGAHKRAIGPTTYRAKRGSLHLRALLASSRRTAAQTPAAAAVAETPSAAPASSGCGGLNKSAAPIQGYIFKDVLEAEAADAMAPPEPRTTAGIPGPRACDEPGPSARPPQAPFSSQQQVPAGRAVNGAAPTGQPMAPAQGCELSAVFGRAEQRRTEAMDATQQLDWTTAQVAARRAEPPQQAALASAIAPPGSTVPEALPLSGASAAAGRVDEHMPGVTPGGQQRSGMRHSPQHEPPPPGALQTLLHAAVLPTFLAPCPSQPTAVGVGSRDGPLQTSGPQHPPSAAFWAPSARAAPNLPPASPSRQKRPRWRQPVRFSVAVDAAGLSPVTNVPADDLSNWEAAGLPMVSAQDAAAGMPAVPVAPLPPRPPPAPALRPLGAFRATKSASAAVGPVQQLAGACNGGSHSCQSPCGLASSGVPVGCLPSASVPGGTAPHGGVPAGGSPGTTAISDSFLSPLLPKVIGVLLQTPLSCGGQCVSRKSDQASVGGSCGGSGGGGCSAGGHAAPRGSEAEGGMPFGGFGCGPAGASVQDKPASCEGKRGEHQGVNNTLEAVVVSCSPSQPAMGQPNAPLPQSTLQPAPGQHTSSIPESKCRASNPVNGTQPSTFCQHQRQQQQGLDLQQQPRSDVQQAATAAAGTPTSPREDVDMDGQARQAERHGVPQARRPRSCSLALQLFGPVADSEHSPDAASDDWGKAGSLSGPDTGVTGMLESSGNADSSGKDGSHRRSNSPVDGPLLAAAPLHSLARCNVAAIAGPALQQSTAVGGGEEAASEDVAAAAQGCGVEGMDPSCAAACGRMVGFHVGSPPGSPPLEEELEDAMQSAALFAWCGDD